MAISTMTVSVNAAKVGDVVGYAQPTDIVATINGYMLESYNVNGYTYICAEDLRYYGFDVAFDYNTRILSVKRNNATQIDPQVANPKFWTIGSSNTNKSILYTDIVTYFNNNYVASCNINGQTIINFNDLSQFGAVTYNNNRREISLILSGVNTNQLADFAANNEASFDNSPDWNVRVRAKGDLLTIRYTSKGYYKLADFPNQQDFNNSVKNGGVITNYKKYLNNMKAVGYKISSIYLEYCTGNGEIVASAQIY